MWPGARLLIEYLVASEPHKPFDCALELGCGVGLVGLWAASRGARVVLTDKAEMLPVARKNLELNVSAHGGLATVEELAWGSSPLGAAAARCLDAALASRAGARVVLLASDCVYQVSLVAPFVETVGAVFARAEAAGGRAELLLSYKTRCVEAEGRLTELVRASLQSYNLMYKERW